MRLTHLAFLGLSLVACRGGGNNGDDDTTTDAPVSQTVHIQDVQNDMMPSGTPVTLEGVIVTAIDSFGAKTGDLWVEEPGGGEFSGVKVFGAPLDQVAALQVGDIVTISNAEKNEFACAGTICGGGEFEAGQSITEIQGAGGGQLSVVKTGTGTVPTPDMVDAAAIDALDHAGQNAEWEKWEGVLINVVNARQLSADNTFGGGADDQHAFKVSGDASGRVGARGDSGVGDVRHLLLRHRRHRRLLLRLPAAAARGSGVHRRRHRVPGADHRHGF